MERTAVAAKAELRADPYRGRIVDDAASLEIGDYVRSRSDRNRRPRTGSGGARAERYVRSSTTSTTSRQSIILPSPKTDPQRTVDAGVVAAHTSSCRIRGVVNHRAGPSDLSCRSRARLLGPLSSPKDARAAGFLAPVAPLTFQPRRSRLMSFRSCILRASTRRGQPSRRLYVNDVRAHEPRTLTPRASHNGELRASQPEPTLGPAFVFARLWRSGMIALFRIARDCRRRLVSRPLSQRGR